MVTIHGVKQYLNSVKHDKLVEIIELARLAMLKNKKVEVGTHFVCPISLEVIAKKSGKKILVVDETTRYCRSQSWYFMSRKSFNKIRKAIFIEQVGKLK